MTDLSFTLPSLLQSWIDQRVAEGPYNDAGEYLRALIRRDQETNAEDTAWVRAMVEAGRNSGTIDAEPEDVIEDIIRERRARRG